MEAMHAQVVAEITDLDRLNMAPLLRGSNQPFDAEYRSRSLLQELETGAILIRVHDQTRLLGYIELMPRQGRRLHVLSLQTHPESPKGAVLRRLLRQALLHLEEYPNHTMTSRVAENNTASIRLHGRLGFRQVQMEDGKLVYAVSCRKLIDHLQRLHLHR